MPDDDPWWLTYLARKGVDTRYTPEQIAKLDRVFKSIPWVIDDVACLFQPSQSEEKARWDAAMEQFRSLDLG